MSGLRHRRAKKNRAAYVPNPFLSESFLEGLKMHEEHEALDKPRTSFVLSQDLEKKMIYGTLTVTFPPDHWKVPTPSLPPPPQDATPGSFYRLVEKEDTHVRPLDWVYMESPSPKPTRISAPERRPMWPLITPGVWGAWSDNYGLISYVLALNHTNIAGLNTFHVSPGQQRALDARVAKRREYYDALREIPEVKETKVACEDIDRFLHMHQAHWCRGYVPVGFIFAKGDDKLFVQRMSNRFAPKWFVELSILRENGSVTLDRIEIHQLLGPLSTQIKAIFGARTKRQVLQVMKAFLADGWTISTIIS